MNCLKYLQDCPQNQIGKSDLGQDAFKGKFNREHLKSDIRKKFQLFHDYMFHQGGRHFRKALQQSFTYPPFINNLNAGHGARCKNTTNKT